MKIRVFVIILAILTLLETGCVSVPNLAELFPEEPLDSSGEEAVQADASIFIEDGSDTPDADGEESGDPNLEGLIDSELVVIDTVPGRPEAAGLSVNRALQLSPSLAGLRLLPKSDQQYRLPMAEITDAGTLLSISGIGEMQVEAEFAGLEEGVARGAEGITGDDFILELRRDNQWLYLFLEPVPPSELILSFGAGAEMPLEIRFGSISQISIDPIIEKDQTLESGDIIRFKAEVSRPGLLLTELIPQGELDGVLEIYGPQGYILTRDEADGGGKETLLFNVSEPGEYTLVVFGFQGDTGLFDFNLNFIPASP